MSRFPCDNDYSRRDIHLRELGFSDYAAYCESELWLDIRERVLALHGYACKLCGAHANVVHHNRYEKEDLTGAKTDFLKPLCHPCHERIEFYKNGQKRFPLAAVRAKFNLLEPRLIG